VTPRIVLAAPLVVITLLAAGCSGRGGSEATPSTTATVAAAGDFGDLKNICQAGKATSSPTQGVTATEIKVGTFSDVGFTKNSEFVDTAKVFTSWCNAAGGINGRKLVSTTRDSALVNVRQQMANACREDFASVGGGSAFDGLGVKDRLTCLLPEFPAQISQEIGADLQLNLAGGPSYNGYTGYYTWLLKEAYPDSANSLGIIAADSASVTTIVAQDTEGLKAAGGTVFYSDKYPAQGVSDWTPYAQALKSKGVKGLIFLGDFLSLSKLEQVLTSINYKLDWIDANNNAYGPAFIQLAAASLGTQNNLADLGGVYPLEKAADNPATKAVVDLFARYAPGAQVTLPAIRAFAEWLLFAKAAASCGDALTRTCLYTAARKETAWSGGGLLAPVDLSQSDAPRSCFNIEKATPTGWTPAGFKPDKGAYRCDIPAYKFTGPYPKPLTLADVGKSMSDLK
jgi:ABC-type branched-subunit amino acid transport system substrate-binding protein